MVQRPTDVLAVRAGLAIRLQALPAERAEARAARVEHLRQLLEARSRLSLKRALMEGARGPSVMTWPRLRPAVPESCRGFDLSVVERGFTVLRGPPRSTC
jgi:hypothetical protein